MIKFKHIRFLIEAYRDRLKQKGVSQAIIDHVETLKSAEKGAAIAKLMANPALEIDDLRVEDIRVKDARKHLQIMDADPTIDFDAMDDDTPPGKYYVILAKWLEEGSIRLPEDGERIREALGYYHEYKDKFVTKYVSKYEKFPDLEQEYLEVSGKKSDSKRQAIRDMKMDGAEKLYDNSEWTVHAITTPEAACYYGKGTRWCTAMDSDDTYAKEYLERGPLYVFRNKITDEKFQVDADFEFFMDATDNYVDDEIKVEMVIILAQIHMQNTNSLVHSQHLSVALDVIATGGLDLETDAFVDSQYGFPDSMQKEWLRTLPNKQFGDRSNAHQAWKVLGLWEDEIQDTAPYEALILKDPPTAMRYVEFVGDRAGSGFKESMKDYILSDKPMFIPKYTELVLKGERWPAGESVLKIAGIRGFFAGQQAETALEYARRIIGGRWEEAEAVIKTNMTTYTEYVEFVGEHGIDLVDDEYIELLVKNGTYADVLQLAFDKNMRLIPFEEAIAKDVNLAFRNNHTFGFVWRYIEHFKVDIPEVYQYLLDYNYGVDLRGTEPVAHAALLYPERIMGKKNGDKGIEEKIMHNPEYGRRYIEKYIGRSHDGYEINMRSVMAHATNIYTGMKEQLREMVYYGLNFGRWTKQTERIVFDSYERLDDMISIDTHHPDDLHYNLALYATDVSRERLPDRIHEHIMSKDDRIFGDAVRNYHKMFGDK